MNILMTCVGRRSYLVDYFKNALEGTGAVICVDIDSKTSAMTAADVKYVVPRVDDDNYIPELLRICIKEKVGLLVSLSDLDLKCIAEAKDRFDALGVKVAVSDPWVIETSNDKWKTYHFLLENDIGCPATFLKIEEARHAIDEGAIKFPLIVKPRWGMGSFSIFKVDNNEELAFFYSYALRKVSESNINSKNTVDLSACVIIQEYIVGDEYGVDILNSLDGERACTVVKRKIAMRSGETDGAITVEQDVLQEVAGKLALLLKHRGNLDVDIIYSPVSHRLAVIEFNARFGGGYPFSHLAGVDFPKALVYFASNRKPPDIILLPRMNVHSIKYITPTTISPSLGGGLRLVDHAIGK